MHKSSKLHTYIKGAFLQVSAFVLATSTILLAFSGTASAAQITSRKLTLGSSLGGAVTSYSFSAVLPTATPVLSINVAICDTPTGTCNIPSGFSVSTPGTVAVTPTNMGSGGTWVASNATPGNLRMANASNTGNPSGTSTFGWTSVTNQTAANSSFYARITTYSAAGYTGALDTGTVAASTAGQITVTASVDETLSFTLASATVGLGTLTSGTTGSGTSTMSASTNATSGYAITVNGSTLTSGGNTITALASNAASTQASSQFGINLMANTTPSVGTAVSGAGTGTPATNYNTANSYRFGTGETVASAAAATNSNTYTVSYIANIPANQQAGSYSTTLTYIASATF